MKLADRIVGTAKVSASLLFLVLVALPVLALVVWVLWFVLQWLSLVVVALALTGVWAARRRSRPQP
jgi:hypothetical protein